MAAPGLIVYHQQFVIDHQSSDKAPDMSLMSQTTGELSKDQYWKLKNHFLLCAFQCYTYKGTLQNSTNGSNCKNWNNALWGSCNGRWDINVPFSFANFASHFISVQIFQIDLSTLASHFTRVQIFQIHLLGTKWTVVNHALLYSMRDSHFSS